MPWKETCAMNERKSLIEAWMSGAYNHAELCRRFGISRRIGYKWITRFEQEGVPGLADRSRARIVTRTKRRRTSSKRYWISSTAIRSGVPTRSLTT